MTMRTLILIAAGVVAACAPAAAQNAPAPSGAPPGMLQQRTASAVFPLNAAYHEIGRAEQAGATGHLLEAARTHYRGALARYGKNDGTGAAAEARLAVDLARAALDERPAPTAPTPRDLPAPPALPSMPGMPGGAGPGPEMRMHEMHVFRAEGPGASGGMQFQVRHRGFDATRLAEELKIETGPEARQLAQNAVDANAAAQRAALAGNVAEASRQSRLSEDLMAAVSALVALNHPELRRPAARVFEIPGTLRAPSAQ
jgi:hypothetical protein